MVMSLEELKKTWIKERDIATEDFLVLAMHVLQMNRTEYSKQKEHFLTNKQVNKLLFLLERRLLKEPVAYLTGQKEFYGRDFHVNKYTLIPRPDSECIIEDVIDFYKKDEEKPQVLMDIGTGSGALAITLQKELCDPALHVFASDITHGALQIAKKNSNSLHSQVTFLEGSLLQPYQPFFPQNKPCYLIANLPYVSENLLHQTELDVQNFEPISALLSADGGLEHYKLLLKEIKILTPWKRLTAWFEISPEQNDSLTNFITEIFPDATIRTGYDLSQKQRFLRFTL